MTIKTISGSYTNGYILAAKYAGISVTSAGVIDSAPAAADTGDSAGVALLLPNGGEAWNWGQIAGGAGGSGVFHSAYFAVGGYGGAGGVGLLSRGVTTAANYGTITGGAGGDGAQGGPQESYYVSGDSQTKARDDALPAKSGGLGGRGGAAVAFTAASTLVNHGAIYGGNGGVGGPGGYGGTEIGPDELMPLPGGPGGPGGAGGSGVDLGAGGELDNLGRIAGGAGGAGALGYYGYGNGGAGGDGVDAGEGARVTNLFLIIGGAGGTSGKDGVAGDRGDGVVLAAGAKLVNGGAGNSLALIEGRVGVRLTGAGEVTNFGSIQGTSGASVDFVSRGDRLVAEAGSTFVGPVLGGGGLLELAGGSGTLTGLGGAVTLAGAVSATISGFGGYQIDAPAAWTLAGASTLAPGKSLDVEGTLSLAGGETFTIRGDLTVSGEVNGVGVLVDQGRLTTTAACVIDSAAAGGLVIDAANTTITNDGLMEATGAGLLLLDGGTVDGAAGGTLLAVSRRVDLENVDIVGGDLATGGTGAIAVAAGRATLDGTGDHPVFVSGTLVVSDNTSLVIEGAIDNAGPIFVKAAADLTDIVVGAGGATLEGGGAILLGASGESRITAAAGAPATLENVYSEISGAGAIGGANLTLINDSSGVIDADQNLALTIGTGANAVVNAGLIEATGRGGLVIKSALDNTGLIFANGGDLTVDGAVSGDGLALVDGATLDFASSVSENILFLDKSALLELAQSRSYTGSVTGFSPNGADKLDLEDIGFSAATTTSYSGNATGGVLTVTQGTHVATIAFIGDYLASTFLAASDGHGGTLITTTTTTPAAAAAAHRFAAAAAALGAGAGESASAAHDASRAHPPVLARPGG
jgi:hypothetical protein